MAPATILAAGGDPRSPQTDRKAEEDLLDKAIEDTFPASDPPSVTRAPRERRETKEAPDQAAEHSPERHDPGAA